MSDVIERPVILPRRSRQGVVLGLDYWNLAPASFALLMIVATIARFGIPGGLAPTLFWVPIVVFSLLTMGGMAFPKLAALWLMKQARHTTGATQTRFRPERPMVAGTLNLPGRNASLKVWDADGTAVVYNPFKKTISMTVELEVSGFMMRETIEKNQLSDSFARVLSGFTQRPEIARVALQERTSPTSIQPARDSYAAAVASRGLDDTTQLAQNYLDVLERSEPFAVSHRNYMTLTFKLIAMQNQIRAFGGGEAGILAVAKLEISNVTDALSQAQIRIRRWLSERQVAALARTAFDPEFFNSVAARSEDEAGVSLAAIGPMALDEPRRSNRIVKSDSGVHTTMWIHEWPRTNSAVGFIEPVVFARHPLTGLAVTHIFTIVLSPVGTRASIKAVDEDKRTWRNNEKARSKRNNAGGAEAEADWDAIVERERAVVAGDGEFRFGAYLTVSARDEQDLEPAVGGMRNALSRAGLEPQILYCQQAEALLINALPLGEGLA